MEETDFWKKCLERLREKCSGTEFETLIQPLQVEKKGNSLLLFAPNDFVVGKIKDRFWDFLHELVKEFFPKKKMQLAIEKGTKKGIETATSGSDSVNLEKRESGSKVTFKYGNRLNSVFTFDSFVKGKSNEFAFAAASQVASEAGSSYNPLLIYGGVGLGKTHLMHAIGHAAVKESSRRKVLYLHSERFVANMIKALQTNTIEEFQQYCRSADFLLIDDIQFFAGKDRSQEEFFHTFNTLLEERKQIVLTCDRYPKEIRGLKERLRSRFGWGLTVAIEPPELETRVAILMNKAECTPV